jgi:hypothetical protein
MQMDNSVIPSRRRLLIGTGIAVGIAGLLLVACVLPAEYGIDPLRIGRLLGLTSLADAKSVYAANNKGGAMEVMHTHDKKFYTGKVEIQLKGKEELEYKARLANGEPLLYAWTTQGGPVYFEFHGEPTEGKWPKDYYRSYQIGQRSEHEQGSFVAPFTGQHGWYWRNLGDAPITIVLEAHGYYTRLGRVERGRAQVE